VRLYSRPGNDLTDRFPRIVEALEGLRSQSCIIDGEAVVCDDNGVASFDRIRHRHHDSDAFLYAFDLIELNGDDLRRDPLQVRKATLASILAKARPGIRFNELGQMARAYPWMVRRVYDEGHTVANHTQNHPIRKMSAAQAAREIEEGFASLREAIGDPQAVSPFFRAPGLLRQKSVEQYLAAHGDMTWSADFVADDWTRINDREVARRAISRIEARGKGILLLHDIHPRTVLARPEILPRRQRASFRLAMSAMQTQ
jgi:hypothetical protein